VLRRQVCVQHMTRVFKNSPAPLIVSPHGRTAAHGLAQTSQCAARLRHNAHSQSGMRFAENRASPAESLPCCSTPKRINETVQCDDKRFPLYYKQVSAGVSDRNDRYCICMQARTWGVLCCFRVSKSFDFTHLKLLCQPKPIAGCGCCFTCFFTCRTVSHLRNINTW